MKRSSAKKKRGPEIAAWGTVVGRELAGLGASYDRGLVEDGRAFRAFHFDDAFFPAKGTFDEYLFQAQEFGWPVFWLAHFAGLHPIGDDGGGDHFLARVVADPDGSSRVYLYDHETGRLTLCFRSIAALVRSATDGADVSERSKVKAPRLARGDDPLMLWERASWIADFVGAGALAGWRETLKQAAPLSVFAKERTQLTTRPDLTAYWLLAHALLGNTDAFAITDAAAAKTKNPFVLALREGARRLLGPSTVKQLALRKLDGERVTRALAELRKRAPASLREGTPPALPTTQPEITVKQVTALAKKGELLAFLDEHPDHKGLHAWALANIKRWAKLDRGSIETIERIADLALTNAHFAKKTDFWLTLSPPVENSGQREAQLLELLAARRSERAAEITLRVLSTLEKNWQWIDLAARAATLAATLHVRKAKPIVARMVEDKTWQRYEKRVMPRLKAALAKL